MNCPLCNSDKYTQLPAHFSDCNTCGGLFKHPSNILPAGEEKQRYSQHENDIYDKDYQQFVLPLTNYVLNNCTETDTGLDFGCGPGPVITYLLQKNNFRIKAYDPYFANKKELLKETYNYIVCCEVIEHFVHPYKEFERLKHLLQPNGRLICKTHLFKNKQLFKDWYYKDDPTHVFIYRENTLKWIAEEFDFLLEWIDERTFVFTN